MEVKGSKAQGRRREAGSEGSAKQKRASMDKNRIRGLHLRVSWQRAAKPISIKVGAGKSGGGARKAVELTTGDLMRVVDSRLAEKRFFVNAQQKSAEGKVVPEYGDEGPNDRSGK
jgi:hypothetical protein